MAMSLFRTKALAFLVGYGVTMALVLVVVSRSRKGADGKKKRKGGDGLTMSDLRTPLITKKKSLRNFLAKDSWNQIESQGSQLGALANHPASMKKRRLGYWTMNRKVVLVMVGLPARGKSYLVKMLIRYLNWIGFPTKVFNIGDYRRKLGYQGVDKSFFDKDNQEGMRIRERMVEVVQDEMYKWLQEDDESKVALFDATNTTKSRRAILEQRAKQEKSTMLVFIESICDDPDILAQNYKLKLKNDDYKDMDTEKALEDFKERVRAYEEVYETIEDCESNNKINYIKLYNVGQKVVTRGCKGYLPSQVAFYLQNVHIGQRKIWLTRHAMSVSQCIGEIGGDTGELTEDGRRYSINMARFLKSEHENLHFSGPGRDILVLIGTQKVDNESIAHLQMMYPVATTPLLNELRGGSFTGMPLTEFEETYPELYAQRQANMLDWRYPGAGGESYMDVIQRVQPIIVELERQPRSLVVVCHLAVQQILYAYFMGVPIKDVPTIDLPQHTIVELTPTPFGTKMRKVSEEEMTASW